LSVKEQKVIGGKIVIGIVGEKKFVFGRKVVGVFNIEVHAR